MRPTRSDIAVKQPSLQQKENQHQHQHNSENQNESSGVANWILFSHVSGMLLDWAMCGDSLICATKTAEVGKLDDYVA